MRSYSNNVREIGFSCIICAIFNSKYNFKVNVRTVESDHGFLHITLGQVQGNEHDVRKFDKVKSDFQNKVYEIISLGFTSTMNTE